MFGLMQDQPLLISSLIEFASRHHGSPAQRRPPHQRPVRAVEGELLGAVQHSTRLALAETQNPVAPGAQRGRHEAGRRETRHVKGPHVRQVRVAALQPLPARQQQPCPKSIVRSQRR